MAMPGTLPVLNEKVVEYAKMRNPEIEIIFVSAKTGEGIDKLAEWVLKNVNEWNN